ncbi:MAG: molybdopterin cofactor-binding domain-containing protein [Candidatus Rokuibacteriota bacterium]
MSTRLIGARIPRNEDGRLLRGGGRFVDDVNPRGVLHAAGCRSPHASARIVRIDPARARALPGVHLVLTAADLGELNEPGPLLIPHPQLAHPRTQRPLAADRVRYVGELVAFVVAESHYVAEDAAELLDVVYEPLPAVSELERALDPLGPRVHDDVPGNLAARLVQTVGAPEAAFRGAARILAERLTIERSCGSPLKTRGVVAEYDPRERALRVWDSTQAPLPIKNGLARIFGLPEFDVDVVAPDVGGGFATKIMLFYPEEILVPLAAIRLGRPVKWIEDRREHLLAANQERGQLHRVEVAIDGDGRILGLRDRFLHDTGAYTPYGIVVPLITASQLPGPYRLRHYHVEFEVAYTNTVAVSPYRGAGRPPGAFVMERVIGLIARELGLEPVEVRRRNFIQPHELPWDVAMAPNVERLLRSAVPEIQAVRLLPNVVAPAFSDSGDLVARVQRILDEEINPAIAAHRGRAVLVAVVQGQARIRLEDGCQGCSLAEVTVRQGIEAILRARLPETGGIGRSGV